MWLCDGCVRYGDMVDGKVLTDVMDVAEKHNGCGRWVDVAYVIDMGNESDVPDVRDVGDVINLMDVMDVSDVREEANVRDVADVI